SLLLEVDGRGHVVSVNDAALRVLARRRDDVVGEPLSRVLPGLVLVSVSVAPGVALFPLPDVAIGERVYVPSTHPASGDGARTAVVLDDVTEKRRGDAQRLDFYR